VNPHILEVIKLYLENRLGHAFKGTMHNTTDNRFEILIRLFTELIPMFGLMLIVFIIDKKQKSQNTSKLFSTEFLWLILIGLSGSLPLMSTLEQRGFYLLTALPFFALTGAVAIANPMNQLVSAIKTTHNGFKYFSWITLLLLIGSITYTLTCFGKTKRDKEMLSDVYALGNMIPRGEKIGIPSEMWETWNFQTYMVRYNYISLDSEGKANRFFVIEKELSKELVPSNYELFPLKTEYLDLYILKNK
jgi:hypothetical protein